MSHVAHAFAIKMISLKNLNHKSKFAVWTISYHSIMFDMTYSVNINIICMCFTIALNVLLISYVVYLGVHHVMNMATSSKQLFISVNINKTLYQPFYELATFTF